MGDSKCSQLDNDTSTRLFKMFIYLFNFREGRAHLAHRLQFVIKAKGGQEFKVGAWGRGGAGGYGGTQLTAMLLFSYLSHFSLSPSSFSPSLIPVLFLFSLVFLFLFLPGLHAMCFDHFHPPSTFPKVFHQRVRVINLPGAALLLEKTVCHHGRCGMLCPASLSLSQFLYTQKPKDGRNCNPHLAKTFIPQMRLLPQAAWLLLFHFLLLFTNCIC